MILLLALLAAAIFVLAHALDGNAPRVCFVVSTILLGVAAALHGFNLA